MAIQGAMPEKGRLTPHLIVRNAALAADFYRRALGAEELYSSPLPGGIGLHVHLKIGDTMVMVTDETPENFSAENFGGLRSPQSLGGTSSLVEIVVDDVDAAFRRAVDAGATPTMPVEDAFWGDRYGWITDPFGHIWALATIQEVLTSAQVEERMMAMMAAAQREE